MKPVVPPPLQARIEAARTHLKRFAFVRRHPETGAVQGVQCMDCGTPVVGLRPVGDPVPVPRPDGVGGRVVVLMQPVQMSQLTTCVNVVFEMSDGSKHFTQCCRDCVARVLTDPEQQEALFLADVADWAEEAARSGHPESYASLLAGQVIRRPVRARLAVPGEV